MAEWMVREYHKSGGGGSAGPFDSLEQAAKSLERTIRAIKRNHGEEGYIAIEIVRVGAPY